MRARAVPFLAAAVALVGLLAACGDDANSSAGPGPAANAAAANALTAPGLQSETQGGITVSGQGTVTADPDTAALSLGVSVVRDTARGARDDAADAMANLLGSLDSNGIAEDDIKTTQFSLNPVYDYSGSQPRLTGYNVTHTLSVTVRDLDRVAEVIDDAVDAVGDPVQISGVTFSLDDPGPLLAQARADAMADALAKAQQLADLGDVALGKPIAISETSGGAPPIFFEAGFAVPAAAETTIQPGQLEIIVTVGVTYAIG